MARKRDEQLAARGAQALIQINRSRGVETDSKYVRLAARAAPSPRRRPATDGSASDERPHPGEIVVALGGAVLGALARGIYYFAAHRGPLLVARLLARDTAREESALMAAATHERLAFEHEVRRQHTDEVVINLALEEYERSLYPPAR